MAVHGWTYNLCIISCMHACVHVCSPIWTHCLPAPAHRPFLMGQCQTQRRGGACGRPHPAIGLPGEFFPDDLPWHEAVVLPHGALEGPAAAQWRSLLEKHAALLPQPQRQQQAAQQAQQAQQQGPPAAPAAAALQPKRQQKQQEWVGVLPGRGGDAGMLPVAVRWVGDGKDFEWPGQRWVCRCGDSSSPAHECPSCGQPAPCR